MYLDPSQPASFGGLDAVYRAIKEKGKNKISREQVLDWLSQQDVYTLQKPAVKEAMEYKLERLNTTLIRSIYNTPIYNRLMYCPGTRLTTNLRATSKEVT